MSYPGGKNGSGVYQTIINQIPPHAVYVEAFLGSGAIMRLKRPATIANIGIDADADVITAFNGDGIPNLQLWNRDAIKWLACGEPYISSKETLVYLDPPYLIETRLCKSPIYRYELQREDHIKLLDAIINLKCKIIISGYYSELYNCKLKEWRTIQYRSKTRGGKMAIEWLWMNYPQPFELHDYRYLGGNFRERERIKRKKARWFSRLCKMGSLERYAILEVINELRSDTAICGDNVGGVPGDPANNGDGRRPVSPQSMILPGRHTSDMAMPDPESTIIKGDAFEAVAISANCDDVVTMLQDRQL